MMWSQIFPNVAPEFTSYFPINLWLNIVSQVPSFDLICSLSTVLLMFRFQMFLIFLSVLIISSYLVDVKYGNLYLKIFVLVSTSMMTDYVIDNHLF